MKFHFVQSSQIWCSNITFYKHAAVVRKARHKNIILQINFNFVSNYFINDIKLALHNKLKKHVGMQVHLHAFLSLTIVGDEWST